MLNWTRSNISREQLLRLVEASQLPPLTATVESKVPGDVSMPRPPKGFVVFFVAFHERSFSVPARRFIRGVLFEYGLQLQHLNPNSIQQMALFEAMYEGYLGISAHWHLFWYFFRFSYLKEGSRAVTIDCANLRMKQDRGDDYIPVTLTSSNSDWHKGWFYLRNDPEFALPVFTGNSIAESRRNGSDGPAKAEQERILKDHWALLGCLQGDRVTFVEVIGLYHAQGVVPLQRRPLRLCEMTADCPPWTGTVTTLLLPSPLEVQRHVAQAIGRSTYSWPPSQLLPMPPNAVTEKIVSCYLLNASCLLLS
jgi:hypothetical protein